MYPCNVTLSSSVTPFPFLLPHNRCLCPTVGRSVLQLELRWCDWNTIIIVPGAHLPPIPEGARNGLDECGAVRCFGLVRQDTSPYAQEEINSYKKYMFKWVCSSGLTTLILFDHRTQQPVPSRSHRHRAAAAAYLILCLHHSPTDRHYTCRMVKQARSSSSSSSSVRDLQ